GPSSEAKKTRVILVPVDDNDPKVDKNIDLPKIQQNLVEVKDRKSGKIEQLKLGQVLNAAEYLDNGIQTLKAKITNPFDLTTEMELSYSGRSPLHFPLNSIKLGP